MDLAERVNTLRQVNGLSVRDLAGLAGVSPSTISRIEARKMDPSFDLATTILQVMGMDIGAVETTDVEALRAGRFALGQDVDLTPGAREWIARWSRIRIVGSDGRATAGREPDVAFRAARLARLADRPGGADFAPAGGAVDLAEMLGRAGTPYALTGDTAADLLGAHATTAWPVLYVEDIQQAQEVLGLVPLASGARGRRITLIPFDGLSELGARTVDGIIIATTTQVAIDCYSGPGRMPDQADLLLGVRG